jgi:chaperone modulatory protein CbpM
MSDTTGAAESAGVRVLAEDEWLAVGDVCRMCSVGMDVVVEFVELGVIVSQGAQPPQWLLPADAVNRLRIASRLMRDLGVNASGAALAIELLESRNELERRLYQLERLAHVPR